MVERVGLTEKFITAKCSAKAVLAAPEANLVPIFMSLPEVSLGRPGMREESKLITQLSLPRSRRNEAMQV